MAIAFISPHLHVPCGEQAQSLFTDNIGGAAMLRFAVPQTLPT
jgi:hypothetical protein